MENLPRRLTDYFILCALTAVLFMQAFIFYQVWQIHRFMVLGTEKVMTEEKEANLPRLDRKDKARR